MLACDDRLTDLFYNTQYAYTNRGTKKKTLHFKYLFGAAILQLTMIK